METNDIWKILDGVQAQIKSYDTKAQIVIGINGALAGFLASQLSTAAIAVVATWGQFKSMALIFSLVICLLSIAVSLAFATFTVYPRLQLNQPDSLIFFDHIVRTFKGDYSKAREVYANRSSDELKDDLSNQVLANSIVSSRKAARFHVALYAMSFALLWWFAAISILFIVHRFLAASHH